MAARSLLHLRVASRCDSRLSTGLSSKLLLRQRLDHLPRIVQENSMSLRTSCTIFGSSSTKRSFNSCAVYNSYSETAQDRSSSKVSHHIAAASSGKGRKYQVGKNTYDFSPETDGPLGLQKDGTIYQKRRARPDSGQDAYFATKIGTSTATAVGVADGVGGWTEQGIDPADFSHGLCSHMVEMALSWPRDKVTPVEKLGPRQLLELGYEAVLRDPQIHAGGSTACVATVSESGRMRVANLGDSGFLQLRLGTVHHYSNPQTHAFNTPFQMSLTPPEILTQASIFGGLPLNDLPERADIDDHTLHHGDVIVLATDGVWDNLSSQDILHTVSRIMREVGAWEITDDRGFIVKDAIKSAIQLVESTSQYQEQTLQARIASKIVSDAKNASLDSKRDGPFAKAVQKEYPTELFHGGKVDDITVVVIIPIEKSEQSPEEGSVKAKL